jgi:hypothetical protein
MRHTLRLLVPAAIALLALPAFALSAPATRSGVVVQRDDRAGALVLATQSGTFVRVRTEHARRISRGSIVRVRGSQVTVLGRVRTATAPSLELRGTVSSQTSTALTLDVAGFSAGLTVQDGTVTVPALAAGTSIEAHVTLGPDPANSSGIVLTLRSLHVDDATGAPAAVLAEGAVTSLNEAGSASAGAITIAGEHGSVTFTIPAGFGAAGVQLGDRVEARGSSATPPVLLSLELSGRHAEQGDDNGNDRDDDHGRHGGGGDNSGRGSSHGGSGSDD